MHIRKSAHKPIPFAITREAVTDRGPAVRHDPAHPDPIVAAQWDDPDDTNSRSRQPWQVHGARRRDGLREMYDRDRKKEDGGGRDGISAARWRAAEDFRRDAETAEGACPPRDMNRVDGGTSGGDYSREDVVLGARRRYREATQHVGLILNAMLIKVVLMGLPLSKYRDMHGGRDEAAKQALLSCLDRLADYYSR